MNRRALLAGASAAILARAAMAEPVPVGGRAGFHKLGPGALWSAAATANRPTQDLDFTTGVLPPAVFFSRASTGTYFDATGTMQTAAAQAPRFDYDPGTKTLRGLLIEETRTNSIRNSMMTGAVPGVPGTIPTNWSLQTTPGLAWSVIGTGVENGITYIDMRLSGTTTNSNPSFLHFDTPGFTASVGQAWALSFYVKMAAGSLTNLTSMSGLVFEQPSGSQHATAAIWPTNAPLNVQRTQNVWTVSTAGTTSVQGSFKINVTGIGVPVDCTFRVGGMQTEQGSFPTSFIPTTTIAAQRTQDNAPIPGGAWLATNTHTLESDFIVPYSSLAGGLTGVSVALDDLSFNNQYVLRTAGAGSTQEARVFAGGASVGGSAGQTFLPYMTMKTAASFDGVNLAGASVANGGAPSSFTFTSAPPVTRMLVGTGRAGAINGWVRRARYWPRLLSVAEMQAATTSDPFTVDFTINGEPDPRLVTTRNSIATYFDSAGTMQSAAIHTPRQDYDPVSLVMRGMLVEEQRTNSILNSTMVGAVAGSPGTDPTGWTIAPGGTGLAKQIVGTGVDHGITYLDVRFTAASTVASNLTFSFTPPNTSGIAAAGGQSWAQSVYVSFVGGTIPLNAGVQIRLNQWDAGLANLGAITAPGGFPPTVAALATQRQRGVHSSLTANCAWIQPFWLFAVAASASPVDFTLRVGAPQMELGAFVTSFIPTSAAAASRIADIAQITNAPIPVAAGSMLAEVFLPQIAPGGPNVEFAFVDQGTANDAMGLRQAGGAGLAQTTYWVGNVNQASPAVGVALVPGAVNKVALTYNRADLSISGTSNGATPTNGTAGALPTPTRMTFGSGRNNYINGHIRKVTVWPRVLSGAELVQVTT